MGYVKLKKKKYYFVINVKCKLRLGIGEDSQLKRCSANQGSMKPATETAKMRESGVSKSD
jgi:hypothetical protein